MSASLVLFLSLLLYSICFVVVAAVVLVLVVLFYVLYVDFGTRP